ncbi:uncharacterized protein BJ171DRAFT_51981 [Polychytrium aggregatum]|uniref:uncharacterized protein n=1 Tax=Polychytrium aggregatum TaxID=110093 RepID=UPI0022FDD774|nr:uncharacterized protein BJ171DRAFT_51981 [Polychytrium aggregatum]KAI9205775.1 hypothetical protein BJ171DRAFT_51981 [Polychytrium aggregatum]
MGCFESKPQQPQAAGTRSDEEIAEELQLQLVLQESAEDALAPKRIVAPERFAVIEDISPMHPPYDLPPLRGHPHNSTSESIPVYYSHTLSQDPQTSYHPSPVSPKPSTLQTTPYVIEPVKPPPRHVPVVLPVVANPFETVATDHPPVNSEDGGTIVCGICQDSSRMAYSVVLRCAHSFCEECMTQHVRHAILNREIPIPCPSCKASQTSTDLDESVIKQCSDAELFKKYGEVCIQRALATDPNAVQCIGEDCSTYFLVDSGERNFMQCPTCLLTWCSQCKLRRWHVGMSCEAALCDQTANGGQVPANDTALDDLILQDKRFTKCPSCATPIEKSEGCNHMECPICRTHFCLLCQQTLKNDPNNPEGLYQHYNDKSTPCYNKTFANPNKLEEDE